MQIKNNQLLSKQGRWNDGEMGKINSPVTSHQSPITYHLSL
ncbi:MAG: hypothetical protein ACKO9I_05760 [Sphaerospermopsis kisseleviana]